MPQLCWFSGIWISEAVIYIRQQNFIIDATNLWINDIDIFLVFSWLCRYDFIFYYKWYIF